MKKKLGMLLLVPAVTLSLAACGNDDGKDKDGKVTLKRQFIHCNHLQSKLVENT